MKDSKHIRRFSEHIKLYPFQKINESAQIDTLQDILLGVVDLGYYYYLRPTYWSDGRGDQIEVVIYGREDRKGHIIPAEIIETIERLVDYLKLEEFHPEDHTSKLIEVLRRVPNQKTKDTDTELFKYSIEWNRETNSYTKYSSISLHFRQ